MPKTKDILDVSYTENFAKNIHENSPDCKRIAQNRAGKPKTIAMRPVETLKTKDPGRRCQLGGEVPKTVQPLLPAISGFTVIGWLGEDYQDYSSNRPPLGCCSFDLLLR